MKTFIFSLLGIILIAPFAHSHGGHDHGSAANAILMPTGNKNGAVVILYREQSCSCCKQWGASMARAGYQVIDHISEDITSLKRAEGISTQLTSCHTAFVDGYFIEGHVPSESIDRLLRDLPELAGLAVPGMPLGSPGMESPTEKAETYDVLAVGIDKSTSVFDSYRGTKRQ